MKEHLVFHANLRVARLSLEDMTKQIKRIVRIMGLGHCMLTLIGKSGSSKVDKNSERIIKLVNSSLEININSRKSRIVRENDR